MAQQVAKNGDPFEIYKSHFKRTIQQLNQLFEVQPAATLICMEHTGIYNNHLLEVFTRPDYCVWLESGKQIRYSTGIQRAKTDSVDALNIARYAQRHHPQARLWKPASQLITKLKALTSLRNRLLLAANTLKQPLKEAKSFMDEGIQKSLEKASASSLKALEKDLDAVNSQIEALIKNDPELNRLFYLLTYIIDIGTVTATGFIVTTQALTDGKTAKQFACYAGVAPFPYQSGSSVRGRTRVSPMGDKQMKTLLHLSAMTAIRAKGELRDYYQPVRPLGLWAGKIPGFGLLSVVNQNGVHYRAAEESDLSTERSAVAVSPHSVFTCSGSDRKSG